MRWRLANKKNYTNTCQVVNGKKQCEVYCDGRDTFDQNTKGIKLFLSTNDVVLVENIRLMRLLFSRGSGISQ